MMTERQIINRIDELKLEIILLERVLDAEHEVGRPRASYKYSEAKINFLRENQDMNMVDLVIKYNEKFSTNLPRTSRALYNFMIRCGILNTNFKRSGFFPVSPESIEKRTKTREANFLKEVGIDGNKKD